MYKKLFNKITATLLCLMVLMSSLPVFADVTGSADIHIQSLGENKFRIKGITDSDNIGKRVSMIILVPNDNEPYTLSDITFSNINTLVCVADQGIVTEATDGSGEYTFDVSLDENSPVGMYQVKCSVKLDEGQSFVENAATAEFMYVSAGQKQQLAEDAETYGATDSVLNAIGEALGFEPLEYANEKERISEVINAEKENGFDDFNALTKAWYAGVLLDGLEKESITKDEFRDYLTIIGVDAALIEKSAEKYPDFISSMGNIAEIVTILQFNKALEEGYVIWSVNSSNRAGLPDVLSENKAEIFNTEALENAYEIYVKLGKEKQTRINAELVDANTNSNDYLTLADFRAAFTTAMTKGGIIDDKPSSSAGNGSSGGGSVSVSGASWGGNKTNEKPTISKTELFTDIADIEWAKESIDVFAKKGIISGYEDGTFRPSNAVTREEFVKLLVMTFELDVNTETEKTVFSDIAEKDWFYNYIMAAADCGIVSGKENGTFGTGEAITRQDAATMIYRAAQYKEVQLQSGKADFADGDIIASYAEKAIDSLAENGIINGKEDNMFAPLADITRAESVVMLYRIWLII